MKRLIALAVAIAVFGIGIGPTIAAGDVPKPKVPPKGIEGPDIRHSTMPPFQSSEGTDVRWGKELGLMRTHETLPSK